MSNNTNPPSHRVYAVTKNGKRNFWQPIGRRFAHESVEGPRPRCLTLALRVNAPS